MSKRTFIQLSFSAIALSLIGFGYWAWVDATIPQGCGLEQNGAWISVDWTSQPINVSNVEQLAQQARQRHFRYLFPYTTYLRVDGFSPSYDHAAEFVVQFRQSNEETKLLAWIGIPLKNEAKFGIKGWTDLANPTERVEIVKFIVKLMHQAKFDGVHLNVETVWDNDPNYLQLLREVRQALGQKYLLSVATPAWWPTPINNLAQGYRWSANYYQQVAREVDQIATMTYDSLSPEAAAYRLWLREQVKGISASLQNSQVELLIGISVSREEAFTHHPKAENLASGLAGMCAGMAELATKPPNGVAIYAAWEADETDWQIWTEWLK
jgi:hypothetical protein